MFACHNCQGFVTYLQIKMPDGTIAVFCNQCGRLYRENRTAIYDSEGKRAYLKTLKVVYEKENIASQKTQ